MSRGNITSYDFSGTALATVNLDGAYTSFLKQDGYLFLLGYDQIDRVDFKGVACGIFHASDVVAV